MGRVVSINTSQVKDIEWKGKMVRTGIFKDPANGPIEVKGVNLAGDDQADRRVHGGTYKAVYSYGIEHYPYWKSRFPDLAWQHGMFGENLTTEGILEEETYIGDILEVGTVQLMAIQPREPCFKLGIRFGTQQIVKQFRQSDYPGIYYKIVKEGVMEAGATITKIREDPGRFSIADLNRLYKHKGPIAEIERALELEHLPAFIKDVGRRLLALKNE